MLLDDTEQQLSAESFHYTPIDLSKELLRQDELSEIIANMTKTLHVNSPELTMTGIESNLTSESKDFKQQQLIDQLQTQLVQNQIQRTQQRNYLRILHESSTPAYWYKTPPVTRSIYFYDPTYQNLIQRRTKSPPRIKPNIRTSPIQSVRSQDRLSSQSNILNQNSSLTVTPRTKYMIDLYQTAVHYQQQRPNVKLNPHISQRNLSTSPRFSTLPPIHSSKQSNENVSHSEQTNGLSVVIETKRKS